MRWFWIDRFIEFVSGERAVAIKNVSLAEEQVDGYLPGYPVAPVSLIIEGLAQTAGLLVGESTGFRERIVLAKLGKARFHAPARPGDTLTLTACIEDVRDNGAICRGTVHVGDQLLGEVDIVFAHLDDRFPGVDLFEPADFLRMLRTFRLYEVGRTRDGKRLEVPPHLLEAERAASAGDPLHSAVLNR
jgi:3-hydroxyacyl-[acyl-carrier-protein] dehydratase